MRIVQMIHDAVLLLALTTSIFLAGCSSRVIVAQSTHSVVTTPSKSFPVPTNPTTNKTLDELLLFFPAKYPEGDWSPEGLNFEDVSFQAKDGTQLHGWFCTCDAPRAIVLFMHGNGGNITHRSSRMKYLQKELHVTTFIFDYRGYGRSEGTPSVEGILGDARAAREVLAKRAGVDESHIVLMGESLGGAVAANLAGELGARGLVLENTFSSLKDTATHHYPQLAWLVPANKLDSVTSLAKYQGPLLQCHGDFDRTIPISLGRKLFDAGKGVKQFVTMPGNDHNDVLSNEYNKMLNRWISSLPK